MAAYVFGFHPSVINVCCRRGLRSLFQRVRAWIRRQMKKNMSTQKKFNFNYDPLSYALNFDNGNFGFFC